MKLKLWLKTRISRIMMKIVQLKAITYPSEECNVETGSITVDKLESKHLGD